MRTPALGARGAAAAMAQNGEGRCFRRLRLCVAAGNPAPLRVHGGDRDRGGSPGVATAATAAGRRGRRPGARAGGGLLGAKRGVPVAGPGGEVRVGLVRLARPLPLHRRRPRPGARRPHARGVPCRLCGSAPAPRDEGGAGELPGSGWARGGGDGDARGVLDLRVRPRFRAAAVPLALARAGLLPDRDGVGRDGAAVGEARLRGDLSPAAIDPVCLALAAPARSPSASLRPAAPGSAVGNPVRSAPDAALLPGDAAARGGPGQGSARGSGGEGGPRRARAGGSPGVGVAARWRRSCVGRAAAPRRRRLESRARWCPGSMQNAGRPGGGGCSRRAPCVASRPGAAPRGPPRHRGHRRGRTRPRALVWAEDQARIGA